MDTVRAFVSTNKIDLIVVDSVAALVPKKEVEGEAPATAPAEEKAEPKKKAPGNPTK